MKIPAIIHTIHCVGFVRRDANARFAITWGPDRKRHIVDVRLLVNNRKGGGLEPTHNGVHFDLELLPEVITHLRKIEQMATARGLIGNQPTHKDKQADNRPIAMPTNDGVTWH